MKTIIVWFQGIALASLIAMGTAADTYAAAPAVAPCAVEAAFSPRGGGKELILSVIQQARESIHMATYSFTEPQIAKALLDAKKRGVNVTVIVDKEHNGRKPDRPSAAAFLNENGVSVFITDYFKIQHNKYIVADGATVETGSYNFSRAAELDNAENVVVLHQCPQIAGTFLKDWQKIRRVSRPF